MSTSAARASAPRSAAGPMRRPAARREARCRFPASTATSAAAVPAPACRTARWPGWSRRRRAWRWTARRSASPSGRDVAAPARTTTRRACLRDSPGRGIFGAAEDRSASPCRRERGGRARRRRFLHASAVARHGMPAARTGAATAATSGSISGLAGRNSARSSRAIPWNAHRPLPARPAQRLSLRRPGRIGCDGDDRLRAGRDPRRPVPAREIAHVASSLLERRDAV